MYVYTRSHVTGDLQVEVSPPNTFLSVSWGVVDHTLHLTRTEATQLRNMLDRTLKAWPVDVDLPTADVLGYASDSAE